MWHVHLGAVDSVIQEQVRLGEALELEQAATALRTARAENEVKLNGILAGGLTEPVLRYHQIEALREMVSRWDGRALLFAGDGFTTAFRPPADTDAPHRTDRRNASDDGGQPWPSGPG